MRRLLIIGVCVAVLCGAATAADPPVKYGSCATAKYPILIVGIIGQDTTSYSPGDADTLAVEFGVDSVDLWVVIGLDDSSGVSPPCDCDTATGANHHLWSYDRVVYQRNAFPAMEATYHSALADTCYSTGCPDTLAIARMGFERSTAAGSTGTAWIRCVGWLKVNNQNTLTPGEQEVKIMVTVTSPSSAGGNRVMVKR